MASEDRTEESVSSDGGEERKPSEVQLLVDLVSRQMEASRQREDRVIQRLERIDLPSVQRSATRDAGKGGPGPVLGAPLPPAQGREPPAAAGHPSVHSESIAPGQVRVSERDSADPASELRAAQHGYRAQRCSLPDRTERCSRPESGATCAAIRPGARSVPAGGDPGDLDRDSDRARPRSRLPASHSGQEAFKRDTKRKVYF